MPPKRNYKRKYTPKKKIFGKMNASKLIAKKRRSNLVSLIKKVTLKQSETKYRTILLGKEELFHNKLHNFNTSLYGVMPTQGTQDDERVGDSIELIGYKFRLMFGQKLDRPNVTFKIYITQFDTALQGFTTTYSDFYHNITGNGLLDPIQSKKWRIMKAITLKNDKSSMSLHAADREYTRAISIWLPQKKKVNFKSDISNIISNLPQEFNIVCLAYDAYGTLITDNIGYWQGAMTVYYKDL